MLPATFDHRNKRMYFASWKSHSRPEWEGVGPLHKGSLLMAAPSGLTRFATTLCVGPLPTPAAGGLTLVEVLASADLLRLSRDSGGLVRAHFLAPHTHLANDHWL